MKKLMILIGALLISVGVMAQEPVQTQKQTKQQTKEQVQTQTQEQTQEPIMVQERVRTNEGQGTMTRAEKREMRKENHGATVSETAKNADPEGGKGDVVREQARLKDGTGDKVKIQQRDQIHKPVRPTGARAPMSGVTPPRTGGMQKGGKR